MSHKFALLAGTALAAILAAGTASAQNTPYTSGNYPATTPYSAGQSAGATEATPNSSTAQQDEMNQMSASQAERQSQPGKEQNTAKATPLSDVQNPSEVASASVEDNSGQDIGQVRHVNTNSQGQVDSVDVALTMPSAQGKTINIDANQLSFNRNDGTLVASLSAPELAALPSSTFTAEANESNARQMGHETDENMSAENSGQSTAENVPPSAQPTGEIPIDEVTDVNRLNSAIVRDSSGQEIGRVRAVNVDSNGRPISIDIELTSPQQQGQVVTMRTAQAGYDRANNTIVSRLSGEEIAQLPSASARAEANAYTTPSSTMADEQGSERTSSMSEQDESAHTAANDNEPQQNARNEDENESTQAEATPPGAQQSAMEDEQNAQANDRADQNSRGSMAENTSQSSQPIEQAGQIPLTRVADASSLDDATVKDSTGQEIGQVENVNTGPSGNPTSVDVHLNQGKVVKLHANQLGYDPQNRVLVAQLPQSEIASLPNVGSNTSMDQDTANPSGDNQSPQ